MLILLPFIEIDDNDVKGDVYSGLFNFELSMIESIEPDEDGDTVIYMRNNNSYTFKLPCSQFIDFISTRVTIDVGLLSAVKKHDKGIMSVMNKIIEKHNKL